MQLWARSRASPFQAPACLIAWAHFYAADRIAGAVVRCNGRLVGLVPVFSWEGRLLLAGTGPTDYNDALVEPFRYDVASAAMTLLGALALARECAMVDLRQLRPESLLIASPTPLGWRSQLSDDEVCPIAPLIGPDGLGALPSPYPRKVRYSQRRCAMAGGVVEMASADTLEEFWQALLRLHAKRWAALGEPGVLGDPLMRAFVQSALPELMHDDLLRLGGVRLGDELVAVLLALRNEEAWCFYLTGFDPDLQAISPGTGLIAAMFGSASAAGAREVQLLRGRESYKYHWGAVDQPTFRRTLTRA